MLQLTVTFSEPNSDGSLSLSESLQQSVASGQLATALSATVGYPVYIAADDHSSLYLGRATLELGTPAVKVKAGQAIPHQPVNSACIRNSSSFTMQAVVHSQSSSAAI